MSEKTIAAKLLIKPNSTYWTASDEQSALLGPLPEGATRRPRWAGPRSPSSSPRTPRRPTES